MTMDVPFVADVAGTVLIVLGAVVFALAGVGVLRLPDLYSRISAITTAAGLGVSLIVLGVVLHEPSVINALKGLLAIVVNVATAAVGGHALGRSGYLTGAPLSDRTHFDDLATYRADS
jgi:multicomponent Na+:H+ antiporter subunit G